MRQMETGGPGQPITQEDRARKSLEEVVSNARLVIRRDTGGRTPNDYKADVAADLRRIISNNPNGFDAAADYVYDNLMKKMQEGISTRIENSLSEIDRRYTVLATEIAHAIKTLEDFKPVRDMLNEKHRGDLDEAVGALLTAIQSVVGQR